LVDAGARLIRPRETPLTAGRYQALAAQNATVRLRAPGGHIYSFTDLTSAHGAVNFGHLNPAIAPFTPASDLVSASYPPVATWFSDWLLKKLALPSHDVLYEASEDAVVLKAIALARQSRPGKVLVVEGSGHTRSLEQRDRGSLKTKITRRRGNDLLTIEVGKQFSSWDEVSCVLVEPILTACGFIPLPLPWLRGLTQAAQAAGVLVIADEIQCGFYRFGKLSLGASEFLRPDLYLFGNSMTNGIYPLFAAVYPDAMEPVEEEAERAWRPEFQTSPLGFQAAEAVARYIDVNDIEDQVAEVHAALSRAGERLAANPRLSAFHLAGPTMSLEVRGGRTGDLVQACQAQGVLIGASANRVLIAPPITIPADHLSHALKVLEQAAKSL